MANETIREAAASHGVKLWEVADHLGIADSTLTRKLRKELPSNEQQNIMSIINSIAESRMEEK